MNYEDKPTLAAWNEKCSVIAGTYTGDGSASRTIHLGVTLKAVLVLRRGRDFFDNDGNACGGLAVPGYGTPVSLTDGGFLVKESGSNSTNQPNLAYYYLALY